MQKMILKPKFILKYLITDDEKTNNLIIFKPKDVELFCFDQSLYEALGSIMDRSKINHNKLVKFMEVVNILSYTKNTQKPRTILTEEKANKINSEVHENVKSNRN